MGAVLLILLAAFVLAGQQALRIARQDAGAALPAPQQEEALIRRGAAYA